MIADSTVWIDALAGRTNWRVDRLRQAIKERTAMVVDQVRLEVLAGVRPYASVIRTMQAFEACEDVMQLHRVDAERAARIFQTCRQAGETPRGHADCLIAAIAIRNEVPVLHRDRDYDVIAKYTPLKVVRE